MVSTAEAVDAPVDDDLKREMLLYVRPRCAWAVPFSAVAAAPQHCCLGAICLPAPQHCCLGAMPACVN